ncbi:NAD(P)-binding protein [Ramaria rubella]|nr:NAD(P)-binding protein [Ramaria rubella]
MEPNFKPLLWLLPVSLCPLLYYIASSSTPKRPGLVPHSQERVLILGASSGIGRATAHLYASRNAYVCIVGRREEQLEAVRLECVDLLPSRDESRILKLTEDFSDPEGLLRIRDLLIKEWNGLDTLVVNAGVSALHPLLSVAGVQKDGSGIPMADIHGLNRVRDIAAAAVQGNFTGPLLSVVAFISFLAKTSKSPSVLLVSSAAALIPAPTRTLYGASKAASLLLFQALSIEHPEVHFASIIPATVEGNFRASAVDGGPVRESLSSALKKDQVARECVHAIDIGRRTLWLPWWYRVAHLAYWIYPPLVEAIARKKYNFNVQV